MPFNSFAKCNFLCSAFSLLIVKAEKKEIVLTEKIQNLHEELQGMKKEILQSEKAKEEIEVRKFSLTQ